MRTMQTMWTTIIKPPFTRIKGWAFPTAAAKTPTADNCLCPPSWLTDHIPNCLRGCACYNETHSPMHTIQFVICDCHNIAILLSLFILNFFYDYNNKYKNIVLFSMWCIRRTNRHAMSWCLFILPFVYLRLDRPMFWAPWHQSMSIYSQPSFSSSTWMCKLGDHCLHTNSDK